MPSVLKQCGQLATIFVTPASFSVPTFCSACAWNRYSLPIRRAGSPVHDSRGPRIAKSTPGGLEQLGGGLRGRARALVERRRAAHPVEHLGCRVAGLQHAHAELGGPVGALGLRLAPRVRGALDVAQHLLGLRRERRVHHHEVAAQVDDVIHVLDRHRALAHARAAGHAIPDDVVGHRVRHERRRLEALLAADQPRALLEHLVAQRHDQQLRRQLLAGRPGGADVLAAPALGAGEGVERLLPGEVRHRAGAEAHLLLGHVEAERLEPPARACAREVDVERRRGDVEVLRVREVGEEADDDQHVRPDEDALEHLRARRRRRTAPTARPRPATTTPATRSGRARSATRARAAAS